MPAWVLLAGSSSDLSADCQPTCYHNRHITQPKELKSIFVVQLPEHSKSTQFLRPRIRRRRSNRHVTALISSRRHLAEVLHVPSNMKLVALPLFELYDNAVRSVTRSHERDWR